MSFAIAIVAEISTQTTITTCIHSQKRGCSTRRIG